MPDFESMRAGNVMQPTESDGAEPRKTIAALYGINANLHALIAEIPLDPHEVGEVLVSDSGRFLVSIRPWMSWVCGRSSTADDVLLAIYTADGKRTGALLLGDVMTDYDVLRLNSMGAIDFDLRTEGRMEERIVLTIPGPEADRATRSVERRIDVATATLLDPKTPIFPEPRVYATAAIGERPKGSQQPAPAECAAAWDDPAIARIPSTRFFAQAVLGPLPPFPALVYKARIRGNVLVDVLVSEQGDVLCTRRTAFPFRRR